MKKRVGLEVNFNSSLSCEHRAARGCPGGELDRSQFGFYFGLLSLTVRKGADRAEIYNLAFSSTAQWLAISSDKGTVHVFSIKVDSGSLENDRSSSTSEISVTNPSGISSLFHQRLLIDVSNS